MSSVFSDAVQSVMRRGFHHETASAFVVANPLLMAQMNRFDEEKGELARAIRQGDFAAAAEEAVDCHIVLSQIFHELGIVDPEAAIRDKLAADEGRGWQHSGEDAPGLFDEEWEHVTEPGVTHWALNGKAPADNGTQGV